MPPKNTRKRVLKPPNSNPSTTITLGEEIVADSTLIKLIRAPSPTPAETSSYPLEPLLSPHNRPLLLSNDTQDRPVDT